MIGDERHYRSMVQSRISYYTSIILALIALTGALAARAESFVNFLLLSPFGLLVAYVANQAITSVERLYNHFIEAIRAREEIEITLGIRDITKLRKDRNELPDVIEHNDVEQSNNYWPHRELLFGSWIPSNNVCGYFCRTEKMFRAFYKIGILIFIVAIALAWIKAN